MDVDEPASAQTVCLVCFEAGDSEQVQRAVCCGKEICRLCWRLLQRRASAGALALLCPFCRRPSEGPSAGAAVLRERIIKELLESRAVEQAIRRVSVVMLLSPSLRPALETAFEALFLFAASSQHDRHRGVMAAAVADKLCAEWPASLEFLEDSFDRFWEDLYYVPRLVDSEISPAADFAAELVRRKVVSPLKVLGRLGLHHHDTSVAQAHFVCAVLLRFEQVLGRASFRELLFNDAYEGNLCEGIFPVGGHQANVKYVRGLFEASQLGWLCEHDAFQPLAMLSDTD
eukprot:TRINITY_DN76003_c0_g1_i1.p1 TRINITY_DN76003_c0_g1~~TRINITY_DN76003_c0_g1_i1.p1  ORF type:complete len:287 (+),score=38.36 TRINITY_DN76003_c0_g1_i1:241-1101(+)